MLGILLLTLWLQPHCSEAAATHISLGDLKNINETCKGEELCGPSHADTRRPKCSCDDACHIYGDCCRDAPSFQSHLGHANPFACVDQPGTLHSYYMVTACPSDAEPVQRQLCRNTNPSADPLANNVPVTVLSSSDGTAVTYRNIHCGRCHRASLSAARMWTPVLLCPDNFPDISPSERRLEWDEAAQQWAVPYDGIRYKCDVGFGMPGDLEHRSSPRDCRSGVIGECVDGWQNTREERLCQSYTSYVYFNNSDIYKNVYCAKCNNKSSDQVSCVELTWRSAGVPFTILLKDPEKDQVCKSNNEVYDAVFDKCRDILCPLGQDECSATRENSVSRVSNESRLDGCKRVALEKEAFQLATDSRSVWVSKYERNFTQGQFRVTEAGKLEICSDDIPQTLDKYSAVLTIVTLVGLGLSILSLLLHLLAVTLVPELRNHSGMNLASLCVALLGAHSSFIAGGFLKSASQQSCSLAAISTYFFFMSAFFWMLALAFDVWRVLRGAVTHLRTSHGKQWCRFISYSFFAWGAPILLTGIALAVETAAPGKVDDRFRPRFGEDSCWFSRRLPLVMFFALPLAVIMILNIIFFASSALMASRSRMNSASANVSGNRRDFRLYLRLAILLGLTWVVGLLASVLNYEILWIGFVVLNTLQGVFIFATFTCTAKVVDALTKPYPWTNRLRRSLKLAPAKPTALLPGDGSQSASDSTMKSTANTMVESSYQGKPSPSSPRKSSAQLVFHDLTRRSSS